MKSGWRGEGGRRKGSERGGKEREVRGEELGTRQCCATDILNNILPHNDKQHHCSKHLKCSVKCGVNIGDISGYQCERRKRFLCAVCVTGSDGTASSDSNAC